ncbi:hypothetical protein DENSPDRAFT_836917 [Dentipellis sp. KUC8613]|nr:hypothetical protein DENSPDRAFT_836917 [Dentipellis sp. KUC8613]
MSQMQSTYCKWLAADEDPGATWMGAVRSMGGDNRTTGSRADAVVYISGHFPPTWPFPPLMLLTHRHAKFESLWQDSIGISNPIFLHSRRESAQQDGYPYSQSLLFSSFVCSSYRRDLSLYSDSGE